MRITFNKFLEYCRYQRNLTQLTCDAYRSDFRDFRGWMLGRKRRITVDRIEPEDIRQYIIAMRKRGLGQNTVLRHLNGMSSFFDYCIKWHGLKLNPVQYCERGKKVKHKVRIPPVEMVERVRAAIRSGTRPKTALQDLAVLELFVSAGLRFSEVVYLEWDAVNFEQGDIIVVGKGNKARKVPMLDLLRSALLALAAIRVGEGGRASGRIVLNQGSQPAHRTALRRWWKRHCKELNDNGYTFHSFRRYFATHLNRVYGIGIVEVKELLGHEDVNTTLAYVEPDLQATKEKLKGARI